MLSSGYAQESETEINYYPENSIHISFGFLSYNNTGDIDNYKFLFSESDLLKNADFEEYKNSFFYNYNINSTFSFQWEHFIKPSENKKRSFHSKFRLGIIYYGMNDLNLNLYKQERIPYDTLTSSNCGVYYRDSVITSHYNMNYHSEQIRINASYIGSTNPKNRFTFYAGAGINAGMSLNSEIIIEYTEYTDIRTNSDYYGSTNFYSFFWDDNINTTEHHDVKNSFYAAGYIPIGLDFRIGKKNEFLSKIHYFLEITPGMNISYIPEINTKLSKFTSFETGINVTL
jgi:hypothetical protein